MTGTEPDREGPEGPATGPTTPDGRAAPAAGDPSPATAGSADGREGRSRWRRRPPSSEDLEQVRQVWRDAMPWDHPMSGTDRLLVLGTLGLLVLMLVTFPLRPFMLASHPVALSALTGSLSAVGAGAAFARVGDGELWLVISAGVFGMVKFDWLFWLAGRRWGERVIALWALGAVADRFVTRIRSWPRWAMPLVVMLAVLPGVPAPAVFATAGLARMRLGWFLVADAIGASLMVGLVAGLGYGLGQYAVDVVLAVDRYAVWIALALMAVLAVRLAYRGARQAGGG